jgi:hypothetical protein
MFQNRSIQRVIVCLAGAVCLAALGGRILAADKPAKEPVKPAADKPKPSIELKPSATPRAATTRPAVDQKFAVAMVQGRALFERYNGREQLEKQFMDLQKQAQAAQQGGDQQKMGELRMQMQKMQGDMRKSIGDALEVVAKRDNIDVVVGDVLYKSETTNLPDITDVVLEQLNSTTTAPAADSADSKPADEKPEAKEPANEK